MKRAREEKKHTIDRVPPVLIPDIATLFHANLITYGVISPATLCNWHATCRRFFFTWLDEEYILQLLSSGQTMTQIAARRPGISRLQFAHHCASLILFDRMLLTVRLAELVYRTLFPSTDRLLSVANATMKKYMYTPIATLGLVFQQLGDAPFKTFAGKETVPMGLQIVCRHHLNVFVTERYGWNFKFVRGEEKMDVPENVDLIWDDLFLLSLRPNITRDIVWY